MSADKNQRGVLFQPLLIIPNVSRSSIMPRAAKPAKIMKSTAVARKPGRPAGAAKKSAAKVTKSSIVPKAAGGTQKAAVALLPKLSKDELRTQVEKLERANAVLRAKGREANKAAKTAAARIAELEDRVTQIETAAAPKPTPTKASQQPKPAAYNRRQPRGRSIDPGDAIPPDVAVEEPLALNEDDQVALQNLEKHLDGE